MNIQNKNNPKNLRLVSFNCFGIKDCIPDIQSICKNADVLCLQEHWLMPHDLGLINKIDEEFSCTSKSSVDTTKVVSGRPYGGTAILYRSSLFTRAEILPCDNDRVIAVRLDRGNRSLLVFCVYMPTNDRDNLPEFTQCLALISAVIENTETECVLMLGDFNAHPGSLFGKELVDYCSEHSLVCLDLERLDANTFTYVSGANSACRWLDHAIASEGAARLVTDVRVEHVTTSSDHFPVIVECDFDAIAPKTTRECNKTGVQNGPKYLWGNRDREQTLLYTNICDNKFNKLVSNFDDIFSNMNCMKTDTLCTCTEHYKCINEFYTGVVCILQSAAAESSDLYHERKRKNVVGWNFYVRRAHVRAREMFTLWVRYGKPRSGYHHNNMTASRREYKAALKYVLKNQEKIRMEMLARHHANSNFVKFWKETKKMNYKSSIPTSVEGEKSKKNIANIFRSHFNVTIGKLSTPSNEASRSSEPHHVTVTPKQIEAILRNMKRGKSPGHDSLSIEHLLFSGQHICCILARLFNLCLRHSYLPGELIRTLVIPIPKNKTGDISSSANYRPISLATIVAKVFERVIHTYVCKIEVDDGQFGFRTQVSTDMAIFALKEVVRYYTQHDTSVYACFLDLSRAFDTINHDILWKKMQDTDVPPEVVGLLAYWYNHQTNNVRWDSEVSDGYRLTCGMRQGGGYLS